MTEAIQIVFRDIPPSATLEANIRRKVERLFRLHEGLTACRVTVERPHLHHHKGSHYQFRVEMHLPGAELVAGKDHDGDNSHDNPYVAARDTFRTARRLLQEHVRKHRAAGRQHERVGELLAKDEALAAAVA